MQFNPETFNWVALLLTISGFLLVAWIVAAWRLSPRPLDLFVSFAFLITACKSSAAPFRGLLDPDYVGFGFGLLQADKGWSVTLAAGSVVLFGVAAAFAALKPGARGPNLFAGSVGLAFLALQLPVFVPLLLTSPDVIVIQFGEYLTVPPAFAIPIGLYMTVGYALAAYRAVRLFIGERSSSRPARA